MNKKKEWTTWAITVSPPSHIADTENFKTIFGWLEKHPSYAYVFETGESGSHLHFHAFVKYEKAVRQDSVARSVKTYLTNHLELRSHYTKEELKDTLKVMVCVKHCYSLEWITDYMGKEATPVLHNLDLPTTQSVEKRRIDRISKGRMNLTFRNFMDAYGDFIKDDPMFTESDQYCHPQRIALLANKMYVSNYDVSIFAKNPKFIINAISIYHSTNEYQNSLACALPDDILFLRPFIDERQDKDAAQEDDQETQPEGFEVRSVPGCKNQAAST